MFCSLALAASAMAEEIVIGHIADLTGATGDVGKPYAEGVQGAADWINANGGVNGKTIKLQRFDYAYKIPEALNIYKKFVTQDKIWAIMGWGTGDTEALKEQIVKDQVVYVSASYSAHLTDPAKSGYNFFCNADYSTMLRAGLKYIKDNWKESRKPKVAFIYPDHPYGKAPIPAGKKYAEELGFEIVGEENVGLKDIDATTQMLSLKSKAPDFAWIGGTTGSTAVILKDAKKQGLSVKFFSNIWGIDENTIKLAGDAAEGALAMTGAVAYGADVPGMKAIKEITKGEPQASHYIRGWMSMLTMAEGLKRADKAGQLNGPGLKAALETMKDFETGGLTAPITYTDKDHRPHMTTYIKEVSGGKLVDKYTETLERRPEWLGF
jgi:branched-chain amino acid transport system substrate-binding protein